MKQLGLLAALLFAVAASPAAAYPVSGFSIWTIGGNGAFCSTHPACGDGGAATSASLNIPDGVAVDAAGDVYIGDSFDHEVGEISPAGIITRIAGTGVQCGVPLNCGDGGAAVDAELNMPAGVAVDAAGNVFIADYRDNEVRKVSPAGTISRLAGTSTACRTAPNCGEGVAATADELSDDAGLALDAAGNLYIGDDLDEEVRWLTGAQAGPAGSTGAAGATGSPGATGTPGPTGAPGPAGKLVLVAFKASIARARVTVRYALTGDATITLAVKPPRGRQVIVARTRGRAGLGRTAWDRKLHGKTAHHGTYKLIVTATVGQDRASSALTVRL